MSGQTDTFTDAVRLDGAGGRCLGDWDGMRAVGARIKGCVKERRRTFALTINQRVPGCHPGERTVAS